MNFLLARWRSYSAKLDPTDRATIIIATVLALAAGVSAQAIIRTWWQ